MVARRELTPAARGLAVILEKMAWKSLINAKLGIIIDIGFLLHTLVASDCDHSQPQML